MLGKNLDLGANPPFGQGPSFMVDLRGSDDGIAFVLGLLGERARAAGMVVDEG